MRGVLFARSLTIAVLIAAILTGAVGASEARETGATNRHASHEDAGPDPLAIPGGGEALVRMQTEMAKVDDKTKAQYARVEEKLGQTIPRGILFRDEQGREVDIHDYMDVPLIIAPVYYSCPGTCHLLLSTLARILPDMGMTPIQDYRVVSVSFDETDTPEIATQRKRNFMAAMNFAYPEDGWVFLSGDKQSIDRFFDAIGFRFMRLGNGDFIHPTMMVVTAPGGKINRYLYGQSFMPVDMTMSVTEAAEGRVSSSLKRVVAYCFTYDADNKRYVFDFMRIAGAVVLFGIVVFVLVFLRGGNNKRNRANRKQ